MVKEQVLEDYTISDQISGIIVESLNIGRIQKKDSQLFIQDMAFEKAVEQIKNVRQFVGKPEHILGSKLTKHGEIAEQVEVGVRNARQILAQKQMTATFHGIGRTAPEDYLVDGISVQSKFINGLNNNLNHVLKHMHKYPEFTLNGSYYHIPNDSFDFINKINNGKIVEGLASKTINAIKSKIETIEAETGKSFDQIIKPGVSEYKEIQQGKVHETLDRHKDELTEKNEQLKDHINENHRPSFSEAAKAAGIGAAVGGAVNLTATIYKKYQQGKNPFKGDFSKEDWSDVGISTGKGSLGGAIAGFSIYELTNYAELSAPFAGAIVSAAKSVGSLIMDYRAGNITSYQFYDLGMMVCLESAIVGICTAAGQTLIPIPVLGAVIGSISGKIFAQFASDQVTDIHKRLQHDMSQFLAKVDYAYSSIIYKINTEFDRLGELTKIAFDIEHNKTLLKSSIELARAYGVEEKNIIKNSKDLDQFMLF